MNSLRKIPLVCLVVSLFRLLSGRLRLSKKYVGLEVRTETEEIFKVFRHIQLESDSKNSESCVFVVRFKFSRLSYKANEIISLNWSTD